MNSLPHLLNKVYKPREIFNNTSCLCLLFILTLLTLLVTSGCSVEKPQYIATENSYSFNENIIKHKTYINSKLVYVYDTKTLEEQYHKVFCAKLSDCSTNIKNIKESAEFGNFDLDKHPIVNNQYGIDIINLYRITYATTGPLGNDEIVSGGVWMPSSSDKNKPPHIKGVVLLFHTTAFYKLTVPSYAPTQKSYLAVAAVLAAQGYIVVAPDYIGMGSNWKTMHPYVLYPQINATDGLSILTATQQFFNTHNFNINTRKPLPLFVTGYSEGSAYAMWFSRLYQEQEKFRHTLNSTTNFKLTAIVPISGTYNLSNITYKFLLSDVNFINRSNFSISNTFVTGQVKPALIAYAMLAYAHYNLNDRYLDVLNSDFFNMKCNWQFARNCQFDGKTLNLKQAFDYNVTDKLIGLHNNLDIYQMQDKLDKDNFIATAIEHDTINKQDNEHNTLNLKITDKIANAAKYIIGNNKIYTNQTNSILPLINTHNSLNNNAFQKLLSSADVYYWHSEIPTALIYLKHNSIISPLQSPLTYKGLQANNSKHVSIIPIDNSLIHESLYKYKFIPSLELDHISGPNYLLIVALNQFNKYTEDSPSSHKE